MKKSNFNLSKEESDCILSDYFFDYAGIVGHLPELEKELRPKVMSILKNKTFSDINKLDSRGNTILHYAVYNNCPLDLVLNILKAGADITKENAKKSNCFQYASQRKYGLGGTYFNKLINERTIRDFLFSNKDYDNFDYIKNFNKETIKFFQIAHIDMFGGGTIAHIKEKARNFDFLDDDYLYYAIGKTFAFTYLSSRKEYVSDLEDEIKEAISKGDKTVKYLLLDVTLGMVSKSGGKFPLEMFGSISQNSLEEMSLILKDKELDKEEKGKLSTILKNFRIVTEDDFLVRNYGEIRVKGLGDFLNIFESEIKKNKDYYDKAVRDINESNGFFKKMWLRLSIDVENNKVNKGVKNKI